MFSRTLTPEGVLRYYQDECRTVESFVKDLAKLKGSISYDIKIFDITIFFLFLSVALNIEEHLSAKNFVEKLRAF